MNEQSDYSINSAWYLVGVLMLAQTCSFIDRMIMGLMVGPIRQSFGISDTQFSSAVKYLNVSVCYSKQASSGRNQEPFHFS